MEILFFLSLLAVVVLGVLYWSTRQQLQALQETTDKQTNEHLQLQTQLQAVGQIRDILMDVVDDGLIMLNSDYRVLYANRKARELAEGPMLGETLLVSLRHRSIDDLLSELSADDTQDTIQQLIDFNGQIKLDVYIQRTLHNNQNHYVILLRDVTALKRAEVARREMVDNITHELNTPITTMNLVVETLSDEDIYRAKKSNKLIKDKINDLRRSLAMVTQLIEEMKILSEIQSGVLPIMLTSIPLRTTIESAVSPLEPLADDKGQEISIEVKSDLVVYAHAYYLERVIKNITHNAIKFSPDGGTVRISATPNDQMVTIAIQDEGVGIPPEQVARIFERFFQVDRARDRARKNGTGLGLAIAKHIIQKHGGEIWVESEEGEGTTFFFSLYIDVSKP